jgi:CheY-like chemotaxis protein
LSGDEAVRILGKERIDLALLDIRLPGMDGYDVAEHILANPLTSHIAVILLTERRERPDRLRGLELGVVDYLTKPFDLDELRLRVRNVLARYQQRHQVNAITKLPLAENTHEVLRATVVSASEWAVVSVLIEGLNAFRSEYGFIAADDFQRALIITLRAALRDASQPDAFVGHLSDAELLVITDSAHKSLLFQSISGRMAESVPLFLPKRARAQQVAPLTVSVVETDHDDNSITSAETLIQALDALRPSSTLDLTAPIVKQNDPVYQIIPPDPSPTEETAKPDSAPENKTETKN